MANHSTASRLLLVDDHPIVSLGLKSLLEDSSDFVLARTVSCNREALSAASQEQPDIIILDLVLPGRNGIEIIPELRRICPQCHIVVYSSLQENLYAHRSIRAGARAYVHKEAGLAELLESLHAVVEGRIHVSDAVKQEMLLSFTNGKMRADDLTALSNQELNVLRLIGTGLRLSDIAAQLNISPKTVGTHRERIKNKLNLHSGKELDQFATCLFSPLPQHHVRE